MSEEDQEQRRREANRLFWRLQARNRLRALADNPEPKTRAQMELDRLRAYLKEWRTRQESGYAGGGDAVSCLAQHFKAASPQATELLEQSDGWAMAIIDASVDDLSAIKPDGALMRSALRVRWLNEGLSPDGVIKIRVYRSGRLQGMSLEEADRLADRAELALVPIVKRRGLPL